MIVMYERASWSAEMPGGFRRPMLLPIHVTFAFDVPSTAAIRAIGTSVQFRKTKACKRLGKCGTETGLRASAASDQSCQNAAAATALARKKRRRVSLVSFNPQNAVIAAVGNVEGAVAMSVDAVGLVEFDFQGRDVQAGGAFLA